MTHLKTKLKSKLDDFGFLYHRYLLFREKYLPTKHQRAEKQKVSSRIAFYSGFISKGDLCFDVGAHYGNRSEIFQKIGAKVIAVEPSNTHSRYLKLKFKDQLEVVSKGLGAKSGHMEMFISENASNSSFSLDWIESVTASGRFDKSSWYKKVTTEVTTMDDLIATYGQPKFCKIDVEGFELEVLNGLNTPVELLSSEFTIPERKEALLKVLNRIHKIDKNYLFNFSFAESMALSLDQWVDYEEIKRKITNSGQFEEKQYGDLYAKLSG